MVLQVQGRTHTAKLSVGNDCNPVTKDVRLVHVVSGQDDSAPC